MGKVIRFRRPQVAFATIPSIIDVASGMLGATIIILLAIAVLEPLEPQRAAIKSKVDKLTQSNLLSDQGWRPSSLKVIDGDTLEISGTRYRLDGFDAPEIGQKCKDADGRSWRCGVDAASVLRELIRSSGEVVCSENGNDRYGRTIAICYADGVDMGEYLVSRGLAWAYRQYSTAYVLDERMARRSNVGIWQAPNTPAWEWRRQN